MYAQVSTSLSNQATAQANAGGGTTNQGLALDSRPLASLHVCRVVHTVLRRRGPASNTTAAPTKGNDAAMGCGGEGGEGV